MARIRQEDVEAVRDRTDLVRLVQQYVALRKAGADRFVGLCPFHTEKTASFGISPSKGFYHCFGCGKGGDAIRFLQEIENLDFQEAVERLASQAGITLRYEGVSPGERRASSRRQALYRANAQAGDLYHRMLLEGREAGGARSYVSSRAMGPESVAGFGIGFAPRYSDFLLRRLARELSPEILVEAGLAMKDARGGIRDRFRSRLVFPIHDLAGKPVGFGARLLEGEGPKYLNSPETAVYRKGELLYNLHRAKADLARTGRALVVEWYTDVIALHQAGIPTAVATCGTALGEAHFRLLSRFCRKVVLAFDSDEAGARAAERAAGMFEGFGLEVSVLILPEGLDPADFVTHRGQEPFEDLVGEAEPLVEYLLRRAVLPIDTSTPEGQSRAVRAGLPILAGLKDEVLVDLYAGVLADLARVGDTVVRMELHRGGRQASGEPPAPARPGEVLVRSPAREVEKEALKLMAQHPELARRHLDRMGEGHFETERNRKALALLREAVGDRTGLAARASERGVAEMIAELSVEPLKGEPSPSYAEQVFARLEELMLSREMSTMKKRLEALNPVTDAPAFDVAFKELADVTSRLRDARARAREGA